MELPAAFDDSHTGGLVTILGHGLSGAHQAAAARVLEQAEAVPGFCTQLVRVLKSSADSSVRLMAMICVRNTVRRHWSEGRSAAGRVPGVVPPEERAAVRTWLLDIAMGDSLERVRSQAITTLARIFRVNWPVEWPDGFTVIMSGLASLAPAISAPASAGSGGSPVASASAASAPPDSAALMPLWRCVLLLHRVLKELSSKTLAHDKRRFTLLACDLLPRIVPLWQAALSRLNGCFDAAFAPHAAAIAALLDAATPKAGGGGDARTAATASSAAAALAGASEGLQAALQAALPLAALTVKLTKTVSRLLHALPHAALLLPLPRSALAALASSLHTLQSHRRRFGAVACALKMAAGRRPPRVRFEVDAGALFARLASGRPGHLEDGDWPGAFGGGSSGGATGSGAGSSSGADSVDESSAVADAEEEALDESGGIARLPCGELLHKLQHRCATAAVDAFRAHTLALAACGGGTELGSLADVFVGWVTASVNADAAAASSAASGSAGGSSGGSSSSSSSSSSLPMPPSGRPFPPSATLSLGVAFLTHLLDTAQRLADHHAVYSAAAGAAAATQAAPGCTPAAASAAAAAAASAALGGAPVGTDSPSEQALDVAEERSRLFAGVSRVARSAYSSASSTGSAVGFAPSSAGGGSAGGFGSSASAAGGAAGGAGGGVALGMLAPDFPVSTPLHDASCLLTALAATGGDGVLHRYAGAVQMLRRHAGLFGPASHDAWLQYCVQQCLTLTPAEALGWSRDSAGFVLGADRISREDSGLRGAGEALLLALVSDAAHAVSVCGKLLAYAQSLASGAIATATAPSLLDLLSGAAAAAAVVPAPGSPAAAAASASCVAPDLMLPPAARAALANAQASAESQLSRLEAGLQAAGLAAADAVAVGVLDAAGLESWFARSLLPLLALCGLMPQLATAAAAAPALAAALAPLRASAGGPLSLDACFALPVLAPALCSLTARRVLWALNCARAVLSPSVRVSLAHICAAIMSADAAPAATAAALPGLAAAVGARGGDGGSSGAGLSLLSSPRAVAAASAGHASVLRPGLRLAAALLAHALVEDASYAAPPLCTEPPHVNALVAAGYSAALRLRAAGADTEAQLTAIAVVGSLLERTPPHATVAAADTLFRFLPALWGLPGAGDGSGGGGGDAGEGGLGYGHGHSGGVSMIRQKVLKALHSLFAALPFAAGSGGSSLSSSAAGGGAGSPAAAPALAPAVFSGCVPLISHSLDPRSPDEVFLCRDGLELLAALLEAAPDEALAAPPLFSLLPALAGVVRRDSEHGTAVAEALTLFILRGGAALLASCTAAGAPSLPPPLAAATASAPGSFTVLVSTGASSGGAPAAGPPVHVTLLAPGCAGALSAALTALLCQGSARTLPHAYAALDAAICSVQASVAGPLAAAGAGSEAVASAVSAALSGALSGPLTALLLSLVTGAALRQAADDDDADAEAAVVAVRRRRDERLLAAFSRGHGSSGSSTFAMSTAQTASSAAGTVLSGGASSASPDRHVGLAASGGLDSGGRSSGGDDDDAASAGGTPRRQTRSERIRAALAAATPPPGAGGGAGFVTADGSVVAPASAAAPGAGGSGYGGASAGSGPIAPPQLDSELAGQGAAVLARLFVLAPSDCLALLSSAGSSHAAALGACGAFTPDLAAFAGAFPALFPRAAALRLLRWLVDAWLDAFEDVALGSSGVHAGSGSGAGGAGGGPFRGAFASPTAGGAVPVSGSAVAMLWRNKMLALACLAALPLAVRAFADLSVQVSAQVQAAGAGNAGAAEAAAAASRFLATVNVLAAEGGSIDAISTLCGDAIGSADVLAAAVAAAAAGGAGSGGASSTSLAGASASAAAAVSAAALFVRGVHDTPARRRSRAKLERHLALAGPGAAAASLAAMSGLDYSALGAATAAAAGGAGAGAEDADEDGIVRTRARSGSSGGGGTFKLLLSAARTSGGAASGFRTTDETEDGDADDDDCLHGLDNDGDDGPDVSDLPLLAAATPSFAAARARLFGGRVETGADLRAAFGNAFAAVRSAVPDATWHALVAPRVNLTAMQRR